jgi:hypothetical protein
VEVCVDDGGRAGCLGGCHATGAGSSTGRVLSARAAG